jgi:hypothetical protein
MEIVTEDETVSGTTLTLVGIFRATLRNGQVFAVDPRNAMYNFTTTAEHERGVFEWNSYMDRLLVANRAAIEVQPLGSLPPNPVPFGNLADGQAGIFVNADVTSTAESKAFSALFTLGEALKRQLPVSLPLKNYQTSFARLMSRFSTDDEHTSEVSAFREQLKAMIRLTSSMTIKEMLFDRLRLKEGN